MEDLAGLGRAVEKLAGVFARGCGVLYRPLAIRNEAKARAEEVRVVGAATTDVEVERARRLAQVEAERRVLLADADEEVLERARTRLVHREVQRQRNLESIAQRAFEQLPEDVSGDPVDDDWIRRFFNYAEDVSDGQMQLLWARILAGEVSKPGSFSLRTLNVVRDLTREDAEFFRIACCLAFDDGFLLQEPSTVFSGQWLAAFGLPHVGLLALQDAGLIHDAEAHTPYQSSESDRPTRLRFVFPYYGRRIMLITRNPRDYFALSVISFTEAGRQLWPFVKREELGDFLPYIAQRLDCRLSELPRGTEEASGQVG